MDRKLSCPAVSQICGDWHESTTKYMNAREHLQFDTFSLYGNHASAEFNTNSKVVNLKWAAFTLKYTTAKIEINTQTRTGGEGEGNEDGQMHRLKTAVGELEEEA